MDEWSDLDEFFVATIRGRRHGIELVSASSSTQSKDPDASDIDMELANDTLVLGEAVERYNNSSGQKRQADMDQSSDDILAHEREKKKQRSWFEQNKKAKMHAWKQAAGLEALATNTTIPLAHTRQ